MSEKDMNSYRFTSGQEPSDEMPRPDDERGSDRGSRE